MDYRIKSVSIDDEKHNLLLIEAMGQELGMEVVSFLDPLKALEHLETQPTDIVLCDYMMPEMDGIEVIKRIRRRNRSIPIVMITAAGNENDLKLRALEAGATEFLNKPLNMPEFRARLINLMDLRKSQILLNDRALMLEEEVRKATERILERENETLQILGRVAEYRDIETSEHIKRVSHYCLIMSESLGDTPKNRELLFNAAPLHDLGKIGIPDSILLKDASLDPGEMAIMRRHPEIGHSILASSQSEFLQAGALISLSHHEKYDGTGYPQGLKGGDIPLFGRILSLADVFDALSSRRPYKTAWPEEEVLQFIKSQSGLHFDPELVDHFFKNIYRIQEIFQSLRDG